MACRACSGSFTAFERTYITCGMGAAAFGVLSVLEHRHDLSAVVLPMTHAPFALAIVFLSVVASVLSYLALNRALEVLPVARTAALINFSTVVSVLAGCSSCASRSAGSAPWPRPPSSSASGACSASPRRHCRTLTSAPSRCPVVSRPVVCPTSSLVCFCITCQARIANFA
ncbi:MAG: hypothetical protein ACLSHG_08810 [Oscillospiraceae bacterium]